MWKDQLWLMEIVWLFEGGFLWLYELFESILHVKINLHKPEQQLFFAAVAVNSKGNDGCV